MAGTIFIVHGDITQLAAHAIAYSTNTRLTHGGDLYSAFSKHLPGFIKQYAVEAPGHLPCQIGHTFWVPVSPAEKPHGVVVVAATGGPESREERRQLAVRNALNEAVGRLRALGLRERLLVALPSFLMGMGGDRRQRLESARVQLATAREALQVHPGVDVAFVIYTPQNYQVFLEARRAVLGEPAEPWDDRYQQLEDALRHGECVLFVGAGLSRGSGLPDWRQLMEPLAAELGIALHDGIDYLDLAQWYGERFGRERLVEMVRRALGERQQEARPTLAHYLLTSLPLRHVVTTNYDDLLERSLAALRRFPVKIVRPEDVARTGQSDGTYVVKFHGDAAEEGRVVLTRDDYDSFFRQRPAMASLLEGLLLNQTFFFVGYSLRDPNFRQIYSRIGVMLQNARRPAFATILGAPTGTEAYVTRQWARKRLHLIGFPGEGLPQQQHQLLRFLDRLADRVTTGTPRLFLAPDVESPGLSPALQEIRRLLIDELGRKVEEAFDPAGNSRLDHHYLAQVLGFLTDLGWVPSWGTRLSSFWSLLAERNPAERRRMLLIALRNTESLKEAEHLFEQLEELERRRRGDAPDPPPAGSPP